MNNCKLRVIFLFLFNGVYLKNLNLIQKTIPQALAPKSKGSASHPSICVFKYGVFSIVTFNSSIEEQFCRMLNETINCKIRLY